MKLVILGGAAHMAQPAVKYLLERENITNIVLADINVDQANKLANQLGSKVSAQFLDINDKAMLADLITDANLVMNFIGPYFRFGTKALEVAIDVGVDYLDICDDYDVTIEALKLNDVAKKKGITALIGIGASPGITNVLSRLGSDALDSTEEINTYWVVGDAEPSGFGALTHMFHIIKGEVPTFSSGKQQNIKAFQKGSSEIIDFGDPVGAVTLYHVGHPEPVTLPKFIPGVKKVTNLGALLPEFQNPMFKNLVDIGMTSEEPIMFRDEPVAPLEFLLALFKQKQDEDKEKRNSVRKQKSIGAVRIEVIGENTGGQASYTFTKSASDSMANGTSIPAGVAATLILEGKVPIKGVIPPECLDPKEMISALNRVNYFEGDKGFEVKRMRDGKTESGSLLDKNMFPEFW
ncbi:saccharopine dehydrogenase NADP-binding domain-containing protein [Sporosarcina sp. 179-K 3D1 HS]|uniref:saccharopine dehydrogenase family protein n=1 Tax=Sporosarcina sp. 179-K 3D1 HS TaxID=3232169 RepID=UPI00399FD8C7